MSLINSTIESEKLLLKSNHLKAENSVRFELKLHSAILFLLILIRKQLKYLLQCCLTCWVLGNTKLFFFLFDQAEHKADGLLLSQNSEFEVVSVLL